MEFDFQVAGCDMTMVYDHGDVFRMDSISISHFKARCLALLAQVQRTGQPLLVTKRGRPLARVLPAPDRSAASWLGCMQGSFEIRGDLLAPLDTDAQRAEWQRHWDETLGG